MTEITSTLDHEAISQKEEEGSYFQDIMIDSKIVTKVKNNGNLNLEDNEGITKSILEKLSRKNIIYYGIMSGEQCVPIEQARKEFQTPVIVTNQVIKRLKKIKEEHRAKLGFIHINVVQIIIRSTFREGLKTPVLIKVRDNRICHESQSLLGQIEGDLGYGVVKFNITLQYPIPFITKNFNHCIGITCEFLNQELMQSGDIPLVVCYRIAYALTNSSISLQYKHLDRIYTEKLFSETSTIIRKDNTQKNFLREHSSKRFLPSIGESSVNKTTQTLEIPTRKNNLYQEDQVEKLRKQVTELNTVVSNLDKRI